MTERTETAKKRKKKAIGTITVSAHRVGEHARTGEILEILGEPGHEHYRVRWENGREAVVSPSSDALVRTNRKDGG